MTPSCGCQKRLAIVIMYKTSTNVLWIMNWCMCQVDAACAQCTHQMAALFCVKWPHGRRLHIKIGLRQSMRIYLKNNRAKFHPDPTWTDGVLSFLEEVATTRTTTRRTRTRWVAIFDQFLIQNLISEAQSPVAGFSRLRAGISSARVGFGSRVDVRDARTVCCLRLLIKYFINITSLPCASPHLLFNTGL